MGLVLLLRANPRGTALALATMGLAVLGATPVWRALLAGYPSDSFFTLSPLAGAGLVSLSAVMIALLFAASLVKTRWLGTGMVTGPQLWAVDIALTAALAYLALWLAPQAYYLYYLTIFDGLPWQSVIKAPPGPGAFLALLLMTEPPNLSIHLQGLCARALLIASALPAMSALAARIGLLWTGVIAGVLHLAVGLV